MNITTYIKLFFISLLSIFITTCGSSGSGVFDDAESATEFTFELSGGSADDFLSDSGDIDQNSQAALNFKTSVAAQVGANPDQIEITGVENINSRNELFILSFIFKEDSEGLIAVDTLVEELMDIISTAILDDTSLTIGDYSADIEEIIIDNLDEDISCPFTTDQCGVCNGPGLNQDGCCGEEVLDDCGNCGNTNSTINDANMMLTEMIQRISWCNDNHYDDDYYYYEHTDHYDCSDELSDWDFDVIYDKYQSALGNGTCSNSAAYFGMGITSMFRVTQDQELIDIIDTWDSGEDDIIISNDRNSQSKIKSGLPKGTSDFTTLSNINYLNYIPIKHLFNSIVNRNSRDNNETIYFSDMQDMIEDVFITKLNDAISHFENVVGNDFMFTITPAMQDDSYADNIEIDDAEIYVMKAYMHSLRALLYAISTYNLDFINSDNFDDGPADGFDFTQLQQNGDYLSIRNGSQNNLPNAFDDLNDIFTSLQSAYTFLGNHVHPNGVLSWDDVSGQDVYDALFIDGPNILNNTHTVEDVCVGGESHSYWGYDGEYYQNDYNDEICYDINVNLKNVMETPINDFKDLLPSYTISDLDNQEMEIGWDNNCEWFDSNETCLEAGDSYLWMNYEWKSNQCWAGVEDDYEWNDWHYQCNPQSESYPNEYSNMIPMQTNCGSTDNCDCSYAHTYAEQMLTNIIDDIGISDLLYIDIAYSESYWNQEQQWCYNIMYKEYVADPCFTWNQNSYSQWQSAWPDVTMSGLFPNMTLNKFLDLTGISQEDDDWWEQSSCSEDDD